MSPHSAGPWKHALAVVNNAPSVYVVRHAKWGSPTIALCEHEADARLIAEAPAMLAALQAIVREPKGKTAADNARVLATVIRIASAAINAANGGKT